MTDNLTPDLRTKVMRSIRSKNTKPELLVRRLLHSMGYRYRLHVPAIPGRARPDIVFRGRRKVIFVHGCFWHVHSGCKVSHLPESPFWHQKLSKNQQRDENHIASLHAAGWSTLVIWECQLSAVDALAKTLQIFLDSPI